MFLSLLKVCKVKFHHCWSPWKNTSDHHLQKSNIARPLEKILLTPMSRSTDFNTVAQF